MPSRAASNEFSDRRNTKYLEQSYASLICSVAALIDSRRHLLRALVAIQEVEGAPIVPEALREWAEECRKASVNCTGFVEIVSAELGCESPFDPYEPYVAPHSDD